ncbi:MAG: zinc-binding dehydrogenase [Microcystaceae cyanobacterium]
MSRTKSEMMKAVRLHQFGKPNVLVFEDAPRPEPKEGQVLVRVLAAGVGPWDGEIRRGEWQGLFDYPLPLILGRDLSGMVAAVGAGVDRLRVGQEIYGIADMTLSGSNAEYAVIDTIGGDTRTRSWSSLKQGGILVASSAPTTPADEAAAKAYGVRTSFVYGTAHAELLEEIGRTIDAGRVKPDVGVVIPLMEAAKAHEMMDSGHHPRGKIVLQVV